MSEDNTENAAGEFDKPWQEVAGFSGPKEVTGSVARCRYCGREDVPLAAMAVYSWKPYFGKFTGVCSPCINSAEAEAKYHARMEGRTTPSPNVERTRVWDGYSQIEPEFHYTYSGGEIWHRTLNTCMPADSRESKPTILDKEYRSDTI